MIGGNRHFDAVHRKRACARPPACVVDQHVEAGVFLPDLLGERSNGSLRRTSAISRSTCEDSDSHRISSSAAFPFSGFRQTMTTRAPIWAKPRAVCFPIPLFAPVTIHTFPLILAGGITFDLSNALVDSPTNFSRGGR